MAKFSPSEIVRSDKGVGFIKHDIDLTNLTIEEKFNWVRPTSPEYASAVALADAIEAAQKKKKT